jgi:hypothetical protein
MSSTYKYQPWALGYNAYGVESRQTTFDSVVTQSAHRPFLPPAFESSLNIIKLMPSGRD